MSPSECSDRSSVAKAGSGFGRSSRKNSLMSCGPDGVGLAKSMAHIRATHSRDESVVFSKLLGAAGPCTSPPPPGPPASCHARACESQKRVVTRLSRREQDGIEAKVRDRDDDRLKRDEMRHSNALPRCICMGQLSHAWQFCF